MNELLQVWRSVDRNRIALFLSIVPGAGHFYKHHYASGLGLLIGGNLLVVFVAVLLGLATFGVSLLVVPVGYLFSVAAAAYYLPDWHGHHHYLHPWTPEVPEETVGEA